MKVAIVHDDLVQWGGAERVLLGLCEIFPQAPIFTSVFDRTNSTLLRYFGTKKIHTSFMQKIPGWKKLYKALLPLYPLAFEQFNFDEYDLVISHTTRFAKSVITKPETLHLSYVHTPPRFLWNFSGMNENKLGQILFSKMRIFDRISSARVDHFLAGSKNAAGRISKVYRRDSALVYPFIDIKRFGNIEGFDGGYFLVIARLNRYKRVDLAIKACMSLNYPLKIAGIGPELEKLKRIADKNVEFLGNVEDDVLTLLIAGAKALIIPGIEDFGLTSLEAQAAGKPVIAYKFSGVSETVIDNQTGFLFDYQTIDCLIEKIKDIEKTKIDPTLCKQNAGRFSKENFKDNFRQAVDYLV